MRITGFICGVIVLVFVAPPLQAQQSLASTLGIQAFPAAGQDAAQQSQDEAASVANGPIVTSSNRPARLEKEPGQGVQFAVQPQVR